ncbi:twin-arginine translocation pathway signal [Mycobacterium kubicae]|uniref:twin-arginine translocation pathway signal n=1 Tax=Mycobacterium kubicae TaxID=120959 RepID=UPI0008006A17|nr:twin-arginine translocation pathway signal [Mycobacterium kubicae]OBF18771.1 twin-arginine translocation pathway signal [Mycobacterium kubicae]
MSAEDASTVDETEVADPTAPAEDSAAADEGAAGESAERSDDDRRPGLRTRLAARAKALSSGRVLIALVTLSVVGSLALLGSLLYFTYLPDRKVDAAAAKVAIAAASEGTVAVLSYSPETLDRDFSSARSRLTGDFLSYYDQFTQQIVAPAAKMKSVKTTAVVLRAALSEFHPDSAVVLLFVNQTTQSKDRPEPTLTSSSVEVKLTKADDKWLISSFNPI